MERPILSHGCSRGILPINVTLIPINQQSDDFVQLFALIELAGQDREEVSAVGSDGTMRPTQVSA